MSTRTGDNIEAAYWNANATATKIYNSLSTASTAGLSTFTTALTVDANIVKYAGASGYMTTNALQTVVRWIGTTGTTVSSGVMATSLTAFNVVGRYMGSTVTVATAFDYYSSGHVIDDTITKGDLDKVILAQILGNTTYDGTTYVLYDHAGTTFVKFEVTTAERTRTT